MSDAKAVSVLVFLLRRCEDSCSPALYRSRVSVRVAFAVQVHILNSNTVAYIDSFEKKDNLR